MIRKISAAVAALFASACATQELPRPAVPTTSVEVQILALNDFHGNLERPEAPLRFQMGSDTFGTGPAGGAATVGAGLAQLRGGHANTITVAAGDLIGASPLTSAYFLDEPTIDAMNLMGLELASVGNHEFDKGSAELLRMQNGGCEKHTTRVPCRLEQFEGAHFQYLGANVVRTDSGGTIFPPTAIRKFGPVTVGFIGMTLKDTGTLVTPTGVAGLRFADEAATANALVPYLKSQGADAIVLLIHQGGKVASTYKIKDCDGLTGEILPILDRLDPAIATIVSGHTHHAYACEMDRGGAKRLLTSAGKYGYLVSDLRLTFDPSTRQLIGQRAENVPMLEGKQDPKIAALVSRYAAAAAPAAARVVGHLSGPAPKSETDSESPAANLIADAQLAATRAKDRGGADISFINATGVRTSLVPGPGGNITYGQVFAMQPFGNNLVVKTMTGTQLKELLEQQFVEVDGRAKVGSLLVPSANFRFTYALDWRKGQRIQSMTLDGKPIDPARKYRVTTNNFLASGGDGYSVFTQGTDTFDAGLDLDALEAYLATNPTAPAVGRIRDVTPRA